VSEPFSAVELFPIVVEGAVDRFCGRPRSRCPYSVHSGMEYAAAWELGWDDADHLLAQRGQEEASRWLSEAA
jgi:hypothetical protein